MSNCPNCKNSVELGTKQCLYCGFIFNEHHFIVIKKKSPAKKSITPIRRVVATLLDTLFMAIPFIISFATMSSAHETITPHGLFMNSWVILLFFSILQSFFLIHDGQTIGKKVMGLAIVEYETNDHPSPFKLIFLRTILPIIPFILPILGISLFALNLAWGLSDDNRCLHDFIAGTQVVEE
jgi:uncharacterized RDD family membrane protein YckC